MYTHNTKIRVRYSETDQMKYVYYGVYAQYFEVGRVELLRSLGITYKELEGKGTALPVINYNVNYKKPAFYDDELTIQTNLESTKKSKITFQYKTFNQEKKLINTATVTLASINIKTGKICSLPKILTDKLT